jgi:hypothetical protein
VADGVDDDVVDRQQHLLRRAVQVSGSSRSVTVRSSDRGITGTVTSRIRSTG